MFNKNRAPQTSSLTRISEALMFASEQDFKRLGFTRDDLSELVYKLNIAEIEIEKLNKDN